MLPQVEPAQHRDWLHMIKGWQETTRQVDIASQEVDELIPPFVMRQLWYETKGNCTVVTDVGQHQMWEAQYFTHEKPGQLITSGGLGTMGFGVPAAIGAKLGKPDELVWAIVGDGGFQQTLQELATIMQDNVHVKIGIINNGFLGMVRQWQQLFYDKNYSGTPMWSPDYMKLAEAYGIPSLRVTTNDEVGSRHQGRQRTQWSLPGRISGQGRGQRLPDGGARRGRWQHDPPAGAGYRAGIFGRAAELVADEKGPFECHPETPHTAGGIRGQIEKLDPVML